MTAFEHIPLVSAQTAIPAAAMLGAARALGILTIFPLFSLFSVVGILRFGLAIGLSAPAVVYAYDVLMAGKTTYLDLGALSLKEFAFGALVGMGLGIPFWAAQSAGDMTDVYRGSNAANLFDPINALETTPLGALLMAIALAIFAASGGVVDLVAIFHKSFELWPLFALVPRFDGSALTTIVDIFARLFRIGAVLAAPFVIVMCAIELSLAFVGRSARQFPLNDSAAAFKNLAVVVVLVVYATFVTTYFGDVWIDGFAGIRSLLEPSLGEE